MTDSLDEMGERAELFFNSSVALVQVTVAFLNAKVMSSEKENEVESRRRREGGFRTGNMTLSLLLCLENVLGVSSKAKGITAAGMNIEGMEKDDRI